jgi:hypothetical protein
MASSVAVNAAARAPSIALAGRQIDTEFVGEFIGTVAIK